MATGSPASLDLLPYINPIKGTDKMDVEPFWKIKK
jgi:hypothetical protein